MDIKEAQKCIPMIFKEFCEFYPQYKLQHKKISVEVTKTEEFYPKIREWKVSID